MPLNSVPQAQSVPQSIVEQCVSAGSTGNTEDLYRLIKEHPLLLDEFDSTPLLETPLHKAAAAGHVSFAVEIMALKPSLSRKLNEDGLTPLHLAFQELCRVDALSQAQHNSNLPLQQIQTEPNQALPENPCTMVYCLLEFDKDLARVKGKEGWTPFHYAAKRGDCELLIQILIICPDSILDLTGDGKTALHIALAYRKHEAFFMLYNWIYLSSSKEAFWRRHQLQNWWFQAKEEILEIKRGLSEENYNKIVHMLCRDSTVGSQRFQFTEETRNALLVVVALLLTINFQVLLTPPGGTWQDDANSHRVGTATMGTSDFEFLYNLNYAALCFSVFTAIFLLPKSPFSLLCIFPLGFLFAFFVISRNIQNPNPDKKFSRVLFLVGLVLIIIYFVIIWFTNLVNFRTLGVHLSCRTFSLRCRRRPLN